MQEKKVGWKYSSYEGFPAVTHKLLENEEEEKKNLKKENRGGEQFPPVLNWEGKIKSIFSKNINKTHLAKQQQQQQKY